MPNIKSAKKRVKVIAAKTIHNKMAKSAVKSTLKSFEETVKAGGENLDGALSAAVSKVDHAAAAGHLHKNTAARRKSAMARAVNAAKSAAQNAAQPNA